MGMRAFKWHWEDSNLSCIISEQLLPSLPPLILRNLSKEQILLLLSVMQLMASHSDSFLFFFFPPMSWLWCTFCKFMGRASNLILTSESCSSKPEYLLHVWLTHGIDVRGLFGYCDFQDSISFSRD